MLEDRSRLREQLVKHEGYRQYAYRDTVGKLTIGYGRNLDDVGVSRLEAEFLLEQDIDKAILGLVQGYDWFERLSSVRQAVLVNMAFNLGGAGLAQFRNTLAMMASGDYDGAANGMLNSKWAGQVKGRATELARMMRSGAWV